MRLRGKINKETSKQTNKTTTKRETRLKLWCSLPQASRVMMRETSSETAAGVRVICKRSNQSKNSSKADLECLSRQWQNRGKTESQELQPQTAVSTWMGLVSTVEQQEKKIGKKKKKKQLVSSNSEPNICGLFVIQSNLVENRVWLYFRHVKQQDNIALNIKIWFSERRKLLYNFLIKSPLRPDSISVILEKSLVWKYQHLAITQFLIAWRWLCGKRHAKTNDHWMVPYTNRTTWK